MMKMMMMMMMMMMIWLQEDQTPLHIAARLGKTEMVQLLLQHMAHPDAPTASGHTPLHISAREGRLETAAVLLEAGASTSTVTKVPDPRPLTRTPRHRSDQGAVPPDTGLTRGPDPETQV